MRLRTPSVLVTLCWTLVATTAPARADSAAVGLALAVTLPIAIPVEILGTIGAIKAARGDDQGYRTTTGWLVMGYVGALANIAGGAGLFAAGAKEGGQSDKQNLMAVGALVLAWGLVDLSLSIWGTTRRARPVSNARSRRARWFISPIIRIDPRFGLLGGLGVSVLML